MDEDERKKPVEHSIGKDVSGLSIGELEERIALLESEITRLKEAIAAKSDSRAAAEAAFKF